MQPCSDQRQLVQPQQWTGYETPPSYSVSYAPSAPPATVPSYYDQVPSEVLPWQQQQGPIVPVVSTPVTGNTSTTVNMGVAVSTAPPPRLAGCCAMGNEKSTMAILYVILCFSIVATLTFFYIILAASVSRAMPDRDFLILLVALPSAILCPVSFSALNGIFSGRTGGLSFMIMMLKIYRVLVSLLACFMVIMTFFAFVLSFSEKVGPLYPAFIVIFIQLAFLVAVSEIIKVLADFRVDLRRRFQSSL